MKIQVTILFESDSVKPDKLAELVRQSIAEKMVGVQDDLPSIRNVDVRSSFPD